MALAVLAGLSTGCGSNGNGSGSTATVSAREIGNGAVRHALEPVVAKLGLQIQRLSVEKRPDVRATYELSVYLRPPHKVSADEYAARFAPLAAAVIPLSFEKYDDIGWIDVCQERAGTPDGVDDAVPVTRLEVSRKDAATVDWARADLVRLFELYKRAPADVGLLANDGVDRTRAWRAALAQTRQPAK